MMMSGVPHEVKEIDFGKNEQKSPEYLKINPSGTCPALEIDGITLCESHTIMRYVCDAKNLPDNWYPKDHRQRALVNRYLDSHHGDIRLGVNNYFIRQVLYPMMKLPVKEEEKAMYEKKYKDILAKLNNSLADKEWIGGTK